MVGKPVTQGTRLTVEYILGLLAHGTTMEEIVEEYPGLAKDDIYACLLFASKTLQDASFVPIKAEALWMRFLTHQCVDLPRRWPRA